VSTLNFTTCDTVEALTAYAGLAPMPRQSGTSVWHRPSIGHTGNGRLRTAFYMATLSAAQHNPVIKAFYTRLRAAGKPEKVARCAAARKLSISHGRWSRRLNGLSQIMLHRCKELDRGLPYLLYIRAKVPVRKGKTAILTSCQQPTGLHRSFRAVGPYLHTVAQDDPRWHLV
jgi:Transposase IS116/IS110/IS902 family